MDRFSLLMLWARYVCPRPRPIDQSHHVRVRARMLWLATFSTSRSATRMPKRASSRLFPLAVVVVVTQRMYRTTENGQTDRQTVRPLPSIISGAPALQSI